MKLNLPTLASVAPSLTILLILPPCPCGAQGNADFFPRGAGREWTYQLTFPEAAPLLYDPYIVNQPILSTNVTHGTTRDRHPAGSTTITFKTVPGAGPAVTKVDLNDEGRRLWFNNEITETRWVLSKSSDTLPENHPWKALLPLPTTLLALELYGVTTIGKENPWILGHILAVVPADGKSKVDKDGWLVEPSGTPVAVPAGRFARVIHSRMPRGEAPVSPFQTPSRPEPHTVDSWVAEGVGLIRSTVTLEGGRVLYRLELADYKPR